MNNNTQKKQYVSPEIEVFMFEIQKPLLAIFSNTNTGGPFSSPMPFDDDEEDED